MIPKDNNNNQPIIDQFEELELDPYYDMPPLIEVDEYENDMIRLFNRILILYQNYNLQIHNLEEQD